MFGTSRPGGGEGGARRIPRSVWLSGDRTFAWREIRAKRRVAGFVMLAAQVKK